MGNLALLFDCDIIHSYLLQVRGDEDFSVMLTYALHDNRPDSMVGVKWHSGARFDVDVQPVRHGQSLGRIFYSQRGLRIARSGDCDNDIGVRRGGFSVDSLDRLFEGDSCSISGGEERDIRE